MNEWAPDVATILGALGVGAILLKLVERGLDALSGRGKKRRDEVDAAWRRGDREAAYRRILQEYASVLRRRLIEAPCVDTDTIDPFPSPPKES